MVFLQCGGLSVRQLTGLWPVMTGIKCLGGDSESDSELERRVIFPSSCSRQEILRTGEWGGGEVWGVVEWGGGEVFRISVIHWYSVSICSIFCDIVRLDGKLSILLWKHKTLLRLPLIHALWAVVVIVWSVLILWRLGAVVVIICSLYASVLCEPWTLLN